MHSPRRSARRVMRLRPEQVEQPGRQIAADHVAVAAGQRPARQQAEADGVLGRQAGAHHRLLEVQQAEIVLAALADHDPAALLGRIAVQAVELVVDLALQVAGVGGDPHRRAVLLRPQRRRRHVAQGLADAGAGLDQHDVGLVLLLARREGLAGRRGVVALGRPRLGHVGPGRDQLGEAQARLARLDRLAARRRRGRRLLPLRQALPDVETGAGPRLLGRRDRCRGRPAPHRPTAIGRAPWPSAVSLSSGEASAAMSSSSSSSARATSGRAATSSSGVVGTREIERFAEPARRRQAEASPAARRRRVPGGRAPAGRPGRAAPRPPAHGRPAAGCPPRASPRRPPTAARSSRRAARHNAPRAVAIRAGQSERGDNTRGG